ncbi:alkaline phosphatase [Alteriqipengyuania lutimaris]|uniref:Alkaline phosphatase n=1 Tax=Alteriqipengyuania lutimaris TaxID=1538146 RepID=A0A395LN30_9SPHN|nr:alkaline phosphatase [Alteriqipengyuania lutimaris]MBB3034167.1 alkaline phosphatase [Alteriqipengyuania lutimaris]RDS76904.1 alkaline phosphatase [Alteriqipengyuania lutimaris]
MIRFTATLAKRRAVTLAAIAALPLGACTSTTNYYGPEDAARSAAAPQAGTAKNVILFVGDGMGISTITAARILAGQQQGLAGEEYRLSFEEFDNVALVKTYNTDAQVPDSAGTASALNTGRKTRIGVINTDPDAPRGDCAGAQGHLMQPIAQEAHERGKAIGIVSTARITHATPAAVYANSPDRNWEADSDIPESQRGLGCNDIAQQLVEFPFDLALGGGSRAFFGEAKGGARLNADADLPAQWAARTGGSFVTDTAAMRRAPLDRPVLGLFSGSHMTYELDREEDTKEPTLTEMTAESIRRLADDPEGFYLMVESGRIDHGHHAGQAGYALEETIEFARAIQYAVENTDPEETLILVTADHSHVFTIAGYPQRGNPILGLVYPPASGDEDHPGGTEGPSLAADGKPYTTLGYANGPGAVQGERPVPETGASARQQALIPSGSETHGGEDVALFGTGPGAQRVRGTIEQNVVYDIMRAAFGWEE